jgi:hypothetical protein
MNGLSMDVVVAVTAIFCGASNVRNGVTANANCESDDRLSRVANERDRGTNGMPEYIVAVICFSIAALALTHWLSAGVTYAILCVTLATRAVVMLTIEERSRVRRAALLQRSRRVDAILLAWIVIATSSVLLLVPAVLDRTDVAAATAVAACVVAMVAVAWRIATAPPVLVGNDVEAELLLDRKRRIRRAGVVCLIAVGSVMFFGAVEKSWSAWPAMATWAALGAWLFFYIKRASRDEAYMQPPRTNGI